MKLFLLLPMQFSQLLYCLYSITVGVFFKLVYLVFTLEDNEGEGDSQDELDLQDRHDEHRQPDDDQDEGNVGVEAPVACTESKGTHDIVIVGMNECMHICVSTVKQILSTNISSGLMGFFFRLVVN